MYKPRKPHELHHTAPQFCGVVYAVFILRGAVAVYEFSQTACAGWFAVLGKNRTARTANTPKIKYTLKEVSLTARTIITWAAWQLIESFFIS